MAFPDFGFGLTNILVGTYGFAGHHENGVFYDGGKNAALVFTIDSLDGAVLLFAVERGASDVAVFHLFLLEQVWFLLWHNLQPLYLQLDLTL